MIDFLFNTLAIIISTLLLGLLYNFINNKTSIAIRKTFGWKFFIIIAFIGTILHELSHLIMVLIFFHMPTKIELFRPIKGKEDGVLGFVEHNYKSTRYRTAGNFFIGCAPMISGSLMIVLLLNYLNIDLKNINITHIDLNIKFLIILFLILSISLCMNMSKMDMKNSVLGCISFIILAISIYIFLELFTKIDLTIITNYYNIITINFVSTLIIGLIICLFMCIFFNLLYLIKYMIKK